MWMIISDSHDNMPKISRAVDIAIERKIDTLIHCGDLCSPFAAKELLRHRGQIYVILGNNDGEKIGLKSLLGPSLKKGPVSIEIDGKKVVVMHEPFGLNDTIVADFLFYGHTHKLEIRIDTKPVIINPGESCGYLTGRATAVLLDPDTLECEIVEL